MLAWAEALEQLKLYLAPLIGLCGVIIASILVYVNTEVQKGRKRNDLYRLLKAEFSNLNRHARIVANEISAYKIDNIASIKTMKYRDGSLFLFDVKEAYLLNENLCQDIMQLSMLSRNNDLHIETLLDDIKNKILLEDKKFNEKITEIKFRFNMTSNLSKEVIDRLDLFKKNPKSYKKPVIKW